MGLSSKRLVLVLLGAGSAWGDKEDPTCSLLNLIPNAAQSVCLSGAQTVCSALAANEEARKRMESGTPMLGTFIVPGTCQETIAAAEGPHQNRWEEFNLASRSDECSGSTLDTVSNATYPFLAGAVSCPKDATKGLSIKAKWLSREEKSGWGPLPGFDVCSADYTPGGLETALFADNWKSLEVAALASDSSVQGLLKMRVACEDVPARVDTVEEKVTPYKMLLMSIGDLPPCQFLMEPATSPPSTPAPWSAATITATPWDSSASSISSSASSESLQTSSASFGSLAQSSSSESSDSDPSNSGFLSGFQASGSSGSYLQLWQWVLLASACCCCCLVAGGAFMNRGKRKKAKKKTPTKPAAPPQDNSEFPLLLPLSLSSASSLLPAMPSYSMVNTGQMPVVAAPDYGYTGQISVAALENPLGQLPQGTAMPVYTSQGFPAAGSIANPYAVPGPYSG